MVNNFLGRGHCRFENCSGITSIFYTYPGKTVLVLQTSYLVPALLPLPLIGKHAFRLLPKGRVFQFMHLFNRGFIIQFYLGSTSCNDAGYWYAVSDGTIESANNGFN